MNLRVFGTKSPESRSDVEDLSLAASAEALTTLDNAPEATAEMVVNTADARVTPVEIERPHEPHSAEILEFPTTPVETFPTGPEASAEVISFGSILEALRDVAA